MKWGYAKTYREWENSDNLRDFRTEKKKQGGKKPQKEKIMLTTKNLHYSECTSKIPETLRPPNTA